MRAKPALRILAIIVILVVFLSPFWILTTISFKPAGDSSSYWLFPSSPTMKNIRTAVEKAGILGAIGRTAFITLFVVVLEVIVSAFAAYPLARCDTRFNKIVLGFILGVMMVPPLSILVSLYSIIVSIKGVNQYWSVILVLLTYQLPMGIFLYVNFIRAIPVALDEAATIDGCGPGRTFFFIIMPLLKPVTASVAILSSVNCWNDFQFSRYILQTKRMDTVTLSIHSFFSQTYIDFSTASACALIAIVPVVVCFLFLQKYFIQGMIDSSVK